MTVNNRRQGNKWTINEMLSLQREYEFLEMTIQRQIIIGIPFIIQLLRL